MKPLSGRTLIWLVPLLPMDTENISSIPLAEESKMLATDREHNGSTYKWISAGLLLRMLDGVAVAGKMSKDDRDVQRVRHWLEGHLKSDLSRLAIQDIRARGGITHTENGEPRASPGDASLETLDDLLVARPESKDPELRGIILPADYWEQHIAHDFADDSRSKDFTNLILSVAFLRQASRAGVTLAPDILEHIWSLVHTALINPRLDTFAASRSAQGFLSVPLCSIIKDKNIDELIRFHVWLPDKKRGIPEFAIHSHQPWVQSWILAGKATDHSYEVEHVKEGEGTHAEYALNWKGEKKGGDKKAIEDQQKIEAGAIPVLQASAPDDAALKDEGVEAGELEERSEIEKEGTVEVTTDKMTDGAEEQNSSQKDQASGDEEPNGEYKTHQDFSIVRNTQVHVRAWAARQEVHTRNMTYTIPKSSYHYTDVDPNGFHATLFYFDSSRGFDEDARVLGPPDEEFSKQYRNPAGVTPFQLATVAEAVRGWEIAMEEGRQYARRAEWEYALRAFKSAVSLCDSSSEIFPNVEQYRYETIAELGYTNRRFGRYDSAQRILHDLLSESKLLPGGIRVDILGELGIIYRHMGLLDDAKRTLEDQYKMAQDLGLEDNMCRAVGNLGMVNYQLSLEKRDDSLLEVAMEQQLERINRARQLRSNAEAHKGRPSDLEVFRTWEIIGLSRLSLCYAALGRIEEAISAAKRSLDLTDDSQDPTVTAITRLFYGRALLLAGRREEALEAFNPVGTCTPAIALCKEPSKEHKCYLRDLVDAGVHLNTVDEYGYSALDYAVFSGDTEAEKIVLEGLRRILDGDVDRQLQECLQSAGLRKRYRDILQERLRPLLIQSRTDHVLERLRRAYANTLAEDESTALLLDRLKFVRYTDFRALGKLPRSTDGFTEIYDPESGNAQEGASYIVFFSYRWIGRKSEVPFPDDDNHTQYRRMLGALEVFLTLHPSVSAQTLGIWLDYACIDQTAPDVGVNALPINLLQCDAVISLTDRDYYTRAWCAVEVLMAQILRRAWGLHHWYECDENGKLHEPSRERDIDTRGKLLTYESDRPKIEFLERQSRLLG
ncbi:hypothetical protein C8Q79DRAFT_286492 [Trametes meyenii]|nr:hypothetical protein C8Q79DRAFT_286492 [Trametes meyenii]